MWIETTRNGEGREGVSRFKNVHTKHTYRYLLLISEYDSPYMRRTNHTGAATRIGICVSANNKVLETAIE